MTIPNPVKRLAPKRAALQGDRRRLGPELAFAAVILIAFALPALYALPREFVMPAISILLFISAGLVALVASTRGRLFEQGHATSQVTYWDVAGALTLIGICAAATVDPDQVVRLVESGRSQN
jgi:hypothetical protein